MPARQARTTALTGEVCFAGLVVVAVACGAAVTAFLALRIDPALHVSTDIIGYATVHDFNPFVYDEKYLLVVLVFPLVSLVTFFLALRVWRRRQLPLPAFATVATTPESDPEPDSSRRTDDVVMPLVRWVAVGATLGLVLAIARDDGGVGAWRDVLLIAALYTTVVLAGSKLLVRRHSEPDRGRQLGLRMSRLNATGAACALVGLPVAAQATQVTVLSDGTVHHYAWLPTWFGALVVVAALIIVAIALLRAAGDARAVARIECAVIFLVTVPVATFLALAVAPGELTHFESFEDGQALTTLRLVQSGAFPWRDWISTHGVLEDAFASLLTTSAVQDSAWGAAAGKALLVGPLCLLSNYLLAYRVIGRRWLLAPVAGLLLLGYGAGLTFVRFIFWPLLLVLLWFVLERRSRWLAAALGAALVIQAVITPEAAYCLPAAGIAVLGADVHAAGWRRGTLRLAAFSRTVWTVVGAVTIGVALVVLLISQHALADFINYYMTFVPGHSLSGKPHDPLSLLDVEQMVLPVVAILAAMALLVVRIWLRLRLTTLNWLLVAAAILEALYYPKFLDRADEAHILEVFATSVPLFITLAASLVEAARSGKRRRRRDPAARAPRPAVVGAVVLLAVLFAFTIGRAVAAAPDHYRVGVSSEPAIASLGYASADALDPSLGPSTVSDIGSFLHAYLPPGGHVFDFTNEPGLLYYVLDFHPSTAYYVVLIAIREFTQHDLITQLAADHPLFVVYSQINIGLPTWDGVPNMVRHYDISQYILAHYRPFADVGGQTIYVLDTAVVPDPSSLKLPLSRPLVTTDLPFRGYNCGWGYSPNFLSVSPTPAAPGALSSSVVVNRESPNSLLLTPPAGHRWGDYRWIEVDAASSFTRSQMTLADEPSPAGEQRAVTFATLATSPRAYRFPIGACSQWQGYGSQPLHLTMTANQDIGAIRLLP